MLKLTNSSFFEQVNNSVRAFERLGLVVAQSGVAFDGNTARNLLKNLISDGDKKVIGSDGELVIAFCLFCVLGSGLNMFIVT